MKRIGVCLLILAFFTPIMAIRGTNAGFSDVEESTGNTFSAASLDARVSYIERFSVSGMTPDNTPNQNMTFKNVGGLDFQYDVKFTKTAGDDALCNALILTAKHGSTVVYDHLLLKDFNPATYSGSPFVISVAGQDSWNFAIELPADAGSALENKNCTWNFDFNAWQTNLPAPTGGFVDMETAGLHSISTGEWLTAGDVVINEIMWMGSTVSTADEWIELKNMTSADIPLAGWKIENAGDTPTIITIPAGKFIPANGYFLIANYAKTNASSALNVDVDYDVLNLSLNNSGNGNLVLKNNAVTPLVIDSALGTPNWGAGFADGSASGLHQSMERNTVLGDGLLPGSWHTCIAGTCNDGIYWDTVDGNNFGTPGAANLSPVVMNEIMFNPSGENKEWAELYNMLDENIDVSGWYFKNEKGDKIVISEENSDNNKDLSDDGETEVPGKGYLTVYLEEDFLDDKSDTLSFYDDMKTPDDEGDDIREDIFEYEDTTKNEDDSFMRIPDGVGIWIDPEATPGEENKLADTELDNFRLLAYDQCFDREKIKKDNKEEICAPAFLQYLGMIKELDDQKIKDSTLLDILEIKLAEEAKKLAVLLSETATMTAGELPAPPVPDEGNSNAETLAGEEEPAKKPEENTDEAAPVAEETPAVEEEAAPAEEVILSPEPTPVETVTPEVVEEVAAPEEEVTAPPEEPAVEEAPADEPEATPASEAPAISL